MAPVKASAIVLRTYRLGETSRVVVCYTRDFGKLRLVAKGVRKGGGRFGGALEPTMVSGVVFYLRGGRDLSLVSQAEIEREFAPLRRDVVRLAYGSAALELADVLVAEREPNTALFDLIVDALGRISAASHDDLDVVLWDFEVLLAGVLGYGPELGSCVACGKPASECSAFSARLGGLVCGDCARDRRVPDLRRGSAVREVARLSEGFSPGRAGALDSATRDAVGELLREFLEEHSGQRLRLKSMEFLAQVRRAELSRGSRGRREE